MFWHPRKTCVRCGLRKYLEEFGRCVKTEDRLQTWCNDCHARYRRSRKVSPITHISMRQRKRSPYENMASVLAQIEASAHQPERVLSIIQQAREAYRL